MKFASTRLVAADIKAMVGFYELVTGQRAEWLAPVFAEMLAQAGYTHPAATWDVPPGLISAELDRSTGRLADTFTPPDRRYTEYFLPGTEPGALRVDARRLFVLGPIMF